MKIDRISEVPEEILPSDLEDYLECNHYSTLLDLEESEIEVARFYQD